MFAAMLALAMIGQNTQVTNGMTFQVQTPAGISQITYPPIYVINHVITATPGPVPRVKVKAKALGKPRPRTPRTLTELKQARLELLSAAL